jgi:hypothetical protein
MKTFPLLVVAAVALLTGCATADFTPYVGEQQRWPTAKGAFVTRIATTGRAGAAPASNTRCPFTSGRQIAPITFLATST